MTLGEGLARDHPTAVAFLDESGSISQDRFFAVGCLKLPEPSILLRQVHKLRDQRHWYEEFHFSSLTKGALPIYKELADLIAGAEDGRFSCFVADRQTADPVVRFGSPWTAYERLAAQLLLGIATRGELMSVLADNYSTPDDVIFEQNVREEVNRRARYGLAVTSVVRLDSKACDPLQVVDLLTSAVAFEYRANAGIASDSGPKAELTDHLRRAYGVASFRGPVTTSQLNVRQYGQ